MSKKILSTSIIQAVADNIRRLRNITSEIQPKNFNEELKKVSSLDNHLMRQVSEIYSEVERVPDYSFYKGIIGGGSAGNKDNILTKITFTKLKSLGSYNFTEYTALKEVILPENYNGEVGYLDFNGCTSLESIDLKETVGFAYGSMENCTNLTAVILRKTDRICYLGSTNAFSNTPIANGNGWIYVPEALLENYKTATNWITYADQIKPIEGSEFE